ncbi:glycine/betaine ABC transporter substrate-binding protein [Pontibacillus yanchengensis]|uniref:Glycine/betaine ABC transporter substrate-binding protein n=1 Tax=Pontibacillus yanchengensis TaxID=462910 RepID=A0A6I5A0F8_9BACI|nr:glycine betaine ABC transporter substrate-binding protein [Pontibacillus yanchengensis]MYL33900.1 glycine/betaine ABC transporter substrate-binding protein [Pontibacillus yanchengensis]
MSTKKLLTGVLLLLVLLLTACNSSGEDAQSSTSSDKKEDSKDETIVFGETTWTSTLLPTQISKQILEKAGYKVETKQISQPLIFKGLQNKEIDFFMDAWLPHTEAELWSKYKEDLQKVATSYEDVPLGWVVPEYVEESTIKDLKGKASKFDERVVTIAAGAGIVEISKQVINDYGLENYELIKSGEATMIATLDDAIEKEEPIIITGWRPHSMFAKYDLKFLEDSKENFKKDNVYVLSYKGLEKDHPKAYKILSEWGIKVSELEEMMLKYEEDGTSFEKLAEQWINNHQEKVNNMLESAEES